MPKSSTNTSVPLGRGLSSLAISPSPRVAWSWIVFVVLVGLLVVASPATALRRGKTRETQGDDCADDPGFLYKKRPKKNGGIVRDCAWIGSLRNKKKRNKICDSTKKGTGKKVKESCQVACDACPPVQESCPSIQPYRGDDCNLQDETKLCNYDYTIIGCTGAIEEAKCVAQSVFSCRGGSWTDSTNDDPGCGDGLGSPFVGDSCDPKTYCAAEPPLHGAPCEDDQARRKRRGLPSHHHGRLRNVWILDGEIENIFLPRRFLPSQLGARM